MTTPTDLRIRARSRCAEARQETARQYQLTHDQLRREVESRQARQQASAERKTLWGVLLARLTPRGNA